MTKSLPKTRNELQLEALHVDGLINVAIGYSDSGNLDKLLTVLEMSSDHIGRLYSALHETNAPTTGEEPKPTDPFLAQYRIWGEAREEWRRLCRLAEIDGCDSPELQVAMDREAAAHKKMGEILPTCQEGFAALAHVIWTDHGPDSCRDSPEYRAECDCPGNRTILNLYRAASGGQAIPLG